MGDTEATLSGCVDQTNRTRARMRGHMDQFKGDTWNKLRGNTGARIK